MRLFSNKTLINPTLLHQGFNSFSKETPKETSIQMCSMSNFGTNYQSKLTMPIFVHMSFFQFSLESMQPEIRYLQHPSAIDDAIG